MVKIREMQEKEIEKNVYMDTVPAGAYIVYNENLEITGFGIKCDRGKVMIISWDMKNNVYEIWITDCPEEYEVVKEISEINYK